MHKWLVITLIVLSCFMVMLLGLGYLLSENEKATILLKNQLAQEAQLEQKKNYPRNNISDYPTTTIADNGLARRAKSRSKTADADIMKKLKKTLVNNLTCVSVAQCQVLIVRFKNIDCTLASNIIGASQVKKITTQTITMDSCPITNPHSQLACQQNICMLVSTTE